jgi:hypothetical protein
MPSPAALNSATVNVHLLARSQVLTARACRQFHSHRVTRVRALTLLGGTGDFKPPEDAAKGDAGARGRPRSAASRALGFLGNALFYGGLLGGAGFVGSTYVYSDEDVKRARDGAVNARGEGVLAEAKARAMDAVLDAREWYTEKVKGFTGARSAQSALMFITLGAFSALLPRLRRVRSDCATTDLDMRGCHHQRIHLCAMWLFRGQAAQSSPVLGDATAIRHTSLCPATYSAATRKVHVTAATRA